MTPIPVVHVETIDNPLTYSRQQIELAFAIACLLSRGKLVLCEAPRR